MRDTTVAEVMMDVAPGERDTASNSYLLITNGPQLGTELALNCEALKDIPLILGRGGPKAKVPVSFILQDPSNRVSAVHATISWREDDKLFVVTDKGSSNGTKVNDQFIAGPTPLLPGDRLSCGTVDMVLMLPATAEGMALPVQRKRGGLRWELLEDGEPGIARLEVTENELKTEKGQPESPRVGSFCRLTPEHSFSIGRFPTNDLQILDPVVGRRHCEIRWLNNAYVINDLGVANPAEVNGEPLVAPRRLDEGDEIVVGRLVLRYRAARRQLRTIFQPNLSEKSGLNGLALRFTMTERPLKTGPEYLRLPLNRQILVGRAENNDLRLHDPSVSRRHARFALEQGRFAVTDIGSANGTKVNGLEIDGLTALQAGDQVKIGDFEFIFEEVSLSETEEPTLKNLPPDPPPDRAENKEASTTTSLEAEAEVREVKPRQPLLVGEPVTLELGLALVGEKVGISPEMRASDKYVPIDHPLRAIPPFDELDSDNFKILTKYFREVNFKAGQEIAREGQSRGAFLAILEGTVIISRALDQGKSRLVLGELGPGTVYGERTIFADQPFANRLEAKTQVRALILEEAVFVRELMPNRTIVSFFRQQVSTNSAANWLKGTLLMQTLSDRTRRALAGLLRYREYEAGQTLAKKGDPCDEFFLVVGGAAQAYSVDNKGKEQSLTALEEGDIFGDGIAAEGETYPMTVRSGQKVECYVLARADFQQVLQKSGDPIASLGRGLSGLPLGAVFNRIPPFNTMPPQLVAQIASQVKVKYFKKGEVIAWQGEQSTALYIVRTGQVQMSYRDSGGVERKDARLGAGQFFGEAALLRETVHTATVTAIEDCELLTLFRNRLQEVMRLGEGYDLGQYFARSLERRFRPKRVADYRIAEDNSATGEIFYILSDESGENFFRLSERGYFLWQKMDGDNTISDLALDYFMEYKLLDLEAVSNIVGQLQAAGFLQVPAVNQNIIGTSSQRKRSRLARFTTFRYEFKNMDGLTDKLYRFGGRFLFARPVLWTLFGLLGLGLVSFIYFGFFEPGANNSASFLLEPPVAIFKGNLWWALLVVALLNFVVHEAAHALACKSYGRKVSRGGFGWMYVGPYFYVNTDDIYLEKRPARIAVDLAGPISNAVVGGVCCLLMFVVSDPALRTLLFQMASVAYLVAYININPLMELDGYYALSNWVEIPGLRKKALVYMRRVVLRQPQLRSVSLRERKIFFWFALLIPVYLFITIVQFLLWFAHILQGLLQSWNGDSKADWIEWVSWAIAVTAASLLSFPLFADLLSAGRPEEAVSNSKKPNKKKGQGH